MSNARRHHRGAPLGHGVRRSASAMITGSNIGVGIARRGPGEVAVFLQLDDELGKICGVLDPAQARMIAAQIMNCADDVEKELDHG